MTSAERLRATYQRKPVDHLFRREFSIWGEAIERWKGEGLPEDYSARNLFNFDAPAMTNVGLDLGWCEPPFRPAYEEKIVRAEGDTEVIQDAAGRWKRCFTGRRHGFMPTYVRHPVTGPEDWEQEVSVRLDPTEPGRYADLEAMSGKVRERVAAGGLMVRQGMVGGYMYLRALMGPEGVLFAFHDHPELVHRMMERWAELMNAGLERLQALISIDELALGEDICYNHGMLISPDMYREFLLPHYRDVVSRARARQGEPLHFHVDTDGWAGPAIPLYVEAGMDVMSPFEVASGCDVIEMGRQWPELVMMGGIDKRVLAAGTDAIEQHLQHIIPAMVRRGGYIPTCDHGVPDNVAFEDYLFYRTRICELDH